MKKRILSVFVALAVALNIATAASARTSVLFEEVGMEFVLDGNVIQLISVEGL